MNGMCIVHDHISRLYLYISHTKTQNQSDISFIVSEWILRMLSKNTCLLKLLKYFLEVVSVYVKMCLIIQLRLLYFSMCL